MAPKLTLISSSNTLSQSTGSPIASALAAAKILPGSPESSEPPELFRISAHINISSRIALPKLEACDSALSSISLQWFPRN